MIDLDRSPALDQDVPDDSNNWSSAAILREIVKMTTVPQVEDGDITVAMLAEFAGIPQKTARSKLDALVRRGVMELVEGLRRNEENRPVRVWRWVQEVQE